MENQFSLDESLSEMRELTTTAGLKIVEEVTQRLNEPNPRTYIGTGKTKEIAAVCERTGVCTVVFDAELSPRQLKVRQQGGGRERGMAPNKERPLM